MRFRHFQIAKELQTEQANIKENAARKEFRAFDKGFSPVALECVLSQDSRPRI
jgi:hypothetical protein